MEHIRSEEAELAMTIQVTRKDTGKVEEYILRSMATPAQVAVVHEAIGALETQPADVANQ